MRNFILGTDWWTDCDDCVALRILARAHKNREIHLLAIGINACMEFSAQSVLGFLNVEGVSDIPLCIDHRATLFGGNPPYQKNLSRYSKRVLSNSDIPDAVTLYRSILVNALNNGEMLEIIEIGFPQLLTGLLLSNPDAACPLNGVELVGKTVSKIWVMAGKWDKQGEKEHNFSLNEFVSHNACAFCDTCPVPITFLGWEVGFDVITGSKLNDDDPLRIAMLDHGSVNGRSSWDPMLAVLALVGDEEKAGYYTVTGKASVNALTGQNFFCENPQGLHKYVVRKYNADYYRDIIDKLIM